MQANYDIQLNPPQNGIRFCWMSDSHMGHSSTKGGNGSGAANGIGADAILAFKESVEISRYYNCDFILHGGDIFHNTNPSHEALKASMETVLPALAPNDNRGLVLKNELSTDVFFSSAGSLPRFILMHGNHDNPGSGAGAVDIFATLPAVARVKDFTAGLDVMDNNPITIQPILISHGTCNLAIYAVPHFSEAALLRRVMDKTIVFAPTPGPGYHRVLALHALRVGRGGVAAAVPPEILPNFDLILYAHEHGVASVSPVLGGGAIRGGAKVGAQGGQDAGGQWAQLGSPVCVSLAQEETGKRFIAVVDVVATTGVHVTAIPLRTTRPSALYQAEFTDRMMKLGNTVIMAEISTATQLVEGLHTLVTTAAQTAVSQRQAEDAQAVGGLPDTVVRDLTNLFCVDYQIPPKFLSLPRIRIKLSTTRSGISNTVESDLRRYLAGASVVANPFDCVQIVCPRRSAPVKAASASAARAAAAGSVFAALTGAADELTQHCVEQGKSEIKAMQPTMILGLIEEAVAKTAGSKKAAGDLILEKIKANVRDCMEYADSKDNVAAISTQMSTVLGEAVGEAVQERVMEKMKNEVATKQAAATAAAAQSGQMEQDVTQETTQVTQRTTQRARAGAARSLTCGF